MRIFAAGLATETNTFAPFPAGYKSFEEAGIFRGNASAGGCVFTPIFKAWKEYAIAEGCEFVEGFMSFAEPCGITNRSAYEGFRDEILADMEKQGPFDIVLLALHGAMVAEGYDDCEGDLLKRVWDICPVDTVIGVELDPHANVTPLMVEKSDVMIAAKEYPHIDFAERAHEVIEISVRTARAELKPTQALFDCKMLGWYPTTSEPMLGLVAKARQMEKHEGVLSVSILHGFPWADIPDVGTKVLAITDGDDDLAHGTSSELGKAIYAQREVLRPRFPSLEPALDLALETPGRVVLADVADNPGGGAAGDNTAMLGAMLRRGIRSAACGFFWDPVAARICADAGVGARLALRLGGKCGPMSSEPLDVEVTVRGVSPRHTQSGFTRDVQLGLSAWVEVEGIDVVIISLRSQTLSPTGFTRLGINLESKKIISVKSAQHFQFGFASLADSIIQVSTRGAMDMDFGDFNYQRLTAKLHPQTFDPLHLDDR